MSEFDCPLSHKAEAYKYICFIYKDFHTDMTVPHFVYFARLHFGTDVLRRMMRDKR